MSRSHKRTSRVVFILLTPCLLRAGLVGPFTTRRHRNRRATKRRIKIENQNSTIKSTIHCMIQTSQEARYVPSPNDVTAANRQVLVPTRPHPFSSQRMQQGETCSQQKTSCYVSDMTIDSYTVHNSARRSDVKLKTPDHPPLSVRGRYGRMDQLGEGKTNGNKGNEEKGKRTRR